jgi:hypothetical protein
MELLGLLVILVIVAMVWKAAFSSGKRLGSRKGYGVGFDRGRRGRHDSSGCLVVFIVVGLALGAAASVAAWF